ncbi:lactate utilization protein C [candidate division KSB1 bacterium]|nr:lactate utilization protein C [candidate division KSB1 bacterium]RQW06967.1 MAG: lactate utilization protein C [candidate division KSB1 bacterium]
MMTTHEFIGTVSRALGRSTPQAPAPLVYRHSVHTDVMRGLSQDALAKEFVDYSRTIGAHVVETTRSQLPASLIQVVKDSPAGSIVVADDPLLRELGIVRLLRAIAPVQLWDVDGTPAENIKFAEKARIGIAVARMALAESGTVLLFSHAGTGRSVTLLPEATIYIIPQSLIRPRLTQGMAYVQEQQNDLPPCINFVSGPSATSDIELVRVVGVHGPMHVVHMLVTDL